METNTKPLYRALNEKRTPGKIKIDTMPLPSRKFIRVTADGVEIAHILQRASKRAKVFFDNEAEATANYTALAVNNLAHLAEALSDMVNEFETLCRLVNQRTDVHSSYNKAKEALQKIS